MITFIPAQASARSGLFLAVTLACIAFNCGADTVTLTNGHVLDGRATDNGDTVTIELSEGVIKLPKTQVQSIVKKSTPQDEFAKGAAELAAKSEDGSLDTTAQVDGWLKLARFANQKQLPRDRDKAYGHVMALDPNNSEAREALGFTLYNGKWMTQVERYQAMGMTKVDGKWISKEALAEIQRARDEERLRQAEADREAQKQEREIALKEADTRRLEAQRALNQQSGQITSDGSGVTFVPGYGGVTVLPPYSNYPQYPQYPGYVNHYPYPSGTVAAVPPIAQPTTPAPVPAPAPAKPTGPQAVRPLPMPMPDPGIIRPDPGVITPNPGIIMPGKTSPQSPDPATSPVVGR